MVKNTTVIIDYGSGNVRSLFNALSRVAQPGSHVTLSGDERVIQNANRLILPGVGAFAECKRKLQTKALIPVFEQHIQQGRPLLGICVGMQLFADWGLEFEKCAGLGWISGSVRELAPKDRSVNKIPHVGWTPISFHFHPLFEGIPQNSFFYFVHSYIFDCSEHTHVLAEAEHGERFTAAVAKKNILGVQFHPEKSDVAGLQLLLNFLNWNP